MKNILKNLIFIVFILLTGVFTAQSSPSKFYAIIPLQGTVNPISSEFIVTSIKRAQSDGAQFIVITIDTPGGLMDSMRDIIKEIFSSSVPIVVYTYPKGAQAASAGGFIMLSGNIAAMSPGCEIGAMHPVSPFVSFSDDKNKEIENEKNVMGMKVLNDTIAYGKGIAQKRGRNEAWVVDAIENAKSSTYLEAKKDGIIDIIAEDMPDLIKQLSGKEVDVNGKKFQFDTIDISEKRYDMNKKERFLNFIANPEIVFFLFILAVAGIGIELKSPGLIFPGVLGFISFVLFLLALKILPVNYLGLGLIVLAVVLFMLELKLTSYGLLTLGGIISFITGAMIMFDSPLEGFSISMFTILSTMALLLVLIFAVIRSVILVHKKATSTGFQGMLHEYGTARTDILHDGKIFIHGEIWDAFSDEKIEKGAEVKIISIDGMKLKVEKK